MRVYDSRIPKGLAWVAAALLIGGCAEVKPSKKNTATTNEITTPEKKDSDVEVEQTVSNLPVSSPSPSPSALPPAEQLKLAAFETTVYPIVKANCGLGGGCHATEVSPLMADANIQKAYDAVIANSKVDFTYIAKSRLILRLKNENHNCWTECQADAVTMTKAVEEFKKKLVEANAIPKGDEIKQTAALAFAAAVDGPGEQVPGQYVKYAKDGTNIVAPLAAAALAVETDSAGGIKDYLVSPTANAGSADYVFNVTQAGNYTLWIRAKINNANAQVLNVSMDGGAPTVWQIENRNPNMWQWDRANPTANNVATSTVYTALPVGNHTVQIRGGSVNVRFNQVALTTSQIFAGGEVVGTAKILTFPAKDLCGGKDVTFKVEVSEWDAASKAITIRNLRVANTVPVTIKSVEALINGKINPQNATFRVVDETVQPPGKLLVRSALQAIGDEGFAKDKLSLSFGTCE